MATAIKRKQHTDKGGRFRVLVGDHLGQGPEGCECDGCLRTEGQNHRFRARRYNSKGEALDPIDYDGDLIDSPVDLVARFNTGPSSRKFERVSDLPAAVAPVAPTTGVAAPVAAQAEPIYLPEGMDAWPRKQLEQFATEHGVDLSAARSRDEMVRVIRTILG